MVKNSRVLGGRMIERSGDVMRGLHRAQGDEECRFFGLASEPRSTVSPCLVSKPVATVLVVWPQN
jgi:hydrogenase maturation factor